MGLSEILNSEESPHLEFKESGILASGPRKIAKQLVGFVNRGGGKLAIGINDDGEIAGDEITLDPVLNRLLDIARKRCSPRVEFSYEFFEEEAGDVLVLDIDSRDRIPHAVVKRTESEISSREHFIRSGNSTRLVSDEELRWLFQNRPNPEVDYQSRWWSVYHKDNLGVPKIELPEVNTYRLAFTDLEDEKKTNLVKSGKMPEYILSLAPFLFLNSLTARHGPSWKSEIKEISVGHQITRKEDVPDIKIDINETQVKGFKDSILSEYYTDPINCIFGGGFSTLEGVEPTIDLCPDEERKSRFILKKPNSFLFEVIFEMAGSWPGIPPEHPRGPNQIGGSEEHEYGHVELHINFSSEFEFPDKQDNKIELHQEYADEIVRLIQDYWSIDEKLSELPDDLLYDVDEKLSRFLLTVGMSESRDN